VNFEDKAGMGSRVVLPYLRYYGVNTLDVLVITHSHEDHAGSVWNIIEKVEVVQVGYISSC